MASFNSIDKNNSIAYRMSKIKDFLHTYKYILLLIGLMQHLFVGIFIGDFEFYVKILWPVNMVILAILASGLFLETHHWTNRFKFLLFLAVIFFPIALQFFDESTVFYLSLTYVLFFCVIFVQVFKYMIQPSYINIDLIIAAICGFLLLLEIFVFTAHVFIYLDPASYNGIDLSNSPSIFTDLVYYCSITLTTIGYGDITPLTHHAKLTASLFGITGHFYQVMLVGVIISKFINRPNI